MVKPAKKSTQSEKVRKDRQKDKNTSIGSKYWSAMEKFKNDEWMERTIWQIEIQISCTLKTKIERFRKRFWNFYLMTRLIQIDKPHILSHQF